MNIIETVEDGHGNILEQTVDHGDGTATVTAYHGDGTETAVTIEVPLSDPVPSAPSDAIAAARQAVAGYSDTNGTKKAVLALCDATEALTQ